MKSLWQNRKRRQKNRAVKKGIKTQIKKVLETAQSGSIEALRKEHSLAAKVLDKAASRCRLPACSTTGPLFVSQVF